jgi:hypothetical protein
MNTKKNIFVNKKETIQEVTEPIEQPKETPIEIKTIGELEKAVVGKKTKSVKFELQKDIDRAEEKFRAGLAILEESCAKYGLNVYLAAINKSDNGISVDIRFSYADEQIEALYKVPAINELIEKYNK